MIFQERPAPPGLDGLVTRLWFLEAPRPTRYEKILPLPFAHLIVNLSAPYRLLDADGTATLVGTAFVAGMRSDYLISELPPRLRHVGAEFTPVGLAALMGAQQAGARAVARTTGRVLHAADAFDGIDDLVAALRADPTPGFALASLAGYLTRFPVPRPDGIVLATLSALQADPDAAIGQLAERLGVTHRTLVARFRRATGWSPKAYAQVWRFHRLVAAVQNARPPDWAALATGSGYYDQPHVIRAFRRFTGWTPAEYHRRVADYGPAEANFVPLDQLPRGLRADQARS